MNTCIAPQFACAEKNVSAFSSVLGSFQRISALAFVFSYVTLPIWGTWLANYYHLHTVSPQDLLLMMCWMPISASILGLSFIKKDRLIPISLRLLVFSLLNCFTFLSFYGLGLI